VEAGTGLFPGEKDEMFPLQDAFLLSGK
jgi:hypothetical protein